MNCGQCNSPKKRILATNYRQVYFLYNIVISIAWFVLKIPAFFNKKLALFIEGRKDVFTYLENHISRNDQIIWVHAASLGEFEQGLPVIQKLKASHPEFKVLVTFFSPSGYEVKKNSKEADLITYLPMDTIANVSRFLELVSPVLAIFVKYEIWPNYLNALNKKEIPILLISGIFNKKQVFFKWYGGFMRKALYHFTHFFVQEKASSDLLQSIDVTNCTINGDTRFDRVSEILERDNSLPFMDSFKGNHLCLVAGSTWPEDEQLFVDYIENSSEAVKYVIAPHDIKEDHIKKLRASFSKKTILYSEIKGIAISDFDVLIMDTIGLLTKIYSYADIAYVGGAFATGLHNTLEPAVFGIPVLIGPQYQGFKEAEDLVVQKGIEVVEDKTMLSRKLDKLLADKTYRKEAGSINAHYILNNKGASKNIVNYIDSLL